MPQTVTPGRRTRTRVRLVKDDITALDVDAFVFYAQPDLVLGAGFGTAISVRGGNLQKEIQDLAPVETGEAVVSGAGNLAAEHIIHAVGPRFQEADTERKLRATVRSALARAEDIAAKRIAFPAMGAGYYGVPLDLCARVMADEIGRHLEGDTCIEEVIYCVVDTRQYQAFEKALGTRRT